jgi:hypothetical protein
MRWLKLLLKTAPQNCSIKLLHKTAPNVDLHIAASNHQLNFFAGCSQAIFCTKQRLGKHRFLPHRGRY